MQPDDRRTARIGILSSEMDAIHFANSLYWKQVQTQNLAAKARYEFRKERLEKIRIELAELRTDAEPA